MAWHVSNSAGILASRFHSNSFTTLPLYAPKAAVEITTVQVGQAGSEMSGVRRATLTEIFAAMDSDKDGKVSLGEYRSAIASKTMQKFFAFIDGKGVADGFLTIGEWLAGMGEIGAAMSDAEFLADLKKLLSDLDIPVDMDKAAPPPLDREALLRKVFASCDDDGSGALSVSEFAELAASQSGIAMAMQEAVFAMLDANSDASLSADEFVKHNLASGERLEDAEFAAQVAQWQALADARSVKSAEPAPPAAEETAVVSGHAQAEELFEKVSEGDVDGLTALLDAGVPAACVNDEGSTALIVAAEGEGECVTLLLARGCPVNHQNAEGLTALMQGVKYEDISIVQAIFGAGASLEPKDSDGHTAVDLARELADPEICNLLTGESKTMEERAPPSMGEGTARRNSVSGHNIEEFTEKAEQAEGFRVLTPLAT